MYSINLLINIDLAHFNCTSQIAQTSVNKVQYNELNLHIKETRLCRKE